MAAWQDINAKGGLRGKPAKHLLREVEGGLPSPRTALDTLKSEFQSLALIGTAGDRAAAALAGFMAARYTFETLQGINGPPNRTTTIQAFHRPRAKPGAMLTPQNISRKTTPQCTPLTDWQP